MLPVRIELTTLGLPTETAVILSYETYALPTEPRKRYSRAAILPLSNYPQSVLPPDICSTIPCISVECSEAYKTF